MEKKKYCSNNVTLQQTSSTFKWLFVFGNALDKPQGFRRALPLLAGPQPGPRAPGTPTTLARSYSQTAPYGGSRASRLPPAELAYPPPKSNK